MQYTKLMGIGSMVSVLLAGSACSAESPGDEAAPAQTVASKGATVTDAQGRDVAPLLELIVGQDHAVAFYEPTPGDLFALESMPSGAKPVLSQFKGFDAGKIFAALRPGEAEPAELTAAVARNLTAPSVASTVTAPHAQGGQPEAALALASSRVSADVDVGRATSALVSSSNPANFVNTGGCDWAPNYSACRVNWSGGISIQANAVSAGCTIDHYAGNGITVQTTRGASVSSSNWAVGFAGSMAWGGNGTVLHRMDILNAAGDAFHAGCRFYP